MEEVATNGLMLELFKSVISGGALLFAIVFPALMLVENLMGLLVSLFTGGEEDE